MRAIGLVAILTLGACTFSFDADTTTTTRSFPPSTVDTPGVSTTVGGVGRGLEIVGCDDAPDASRIVCQAYDYIHDRYVDEISDEVLAKGAEQGVMALDGASSDSALSCVVPSREFEIVCDDLPDEAEDSAEAAEAMVWGMFSFALDPNSTYLDPELVELVEQDQEGEVEGIGALVNTIDSETGELCGVITETCQIVIASVVPNSPAQESGIVAGDSLSEVDGESIIGWSIDEVTTAVRGTAGTEVSLTMVRGSDAYEVTITRAAVEVPVVTSEVVGSTGYVRLSQFTDHGDEQLREAIFGLLTESVDTLVLDLRDNPGGLLTTAIDVASQFLADGEVVETRGPDESEIYEVNGRRLVPDDVRVIVIVNGGSASASELVSALLQERGRATIVGVNTFGKNTVQQQFSLSNGGAIKLTVARWVTPEGLDFGTVGVTPDVIEDFPPDLTTEAVVDLALSIT